MKRSLQLACAALVAVALGALTVAGEAAAEPRFRISASAPVVGDSAGWQ